MSTGTQRQRDRLLGASGNTTGTARQRELLLAKTAVVGEGGSPLKYGLGSVTRPVAGAVGAGYGMAQGHGRPSSGGGLAPNLAKGEKATSNYHSLFAPRFFLEADGKLASDLIPYITSFEFEDEVAKISTLRITVLNPGLRFADDPRFKEGVRFRFRFGYLSDISDIYNAVISKAKPSFPQSGIPTIQMVAYGLEKDLNLQANPMNHGPVSSSDVAKVIAERYKFDTSEIEDSKDARTQNRIQPAGISDLQYIMSLAYKLNWVCFVKGDKLHFHPRRYDKPAVLEFTYFTDQTGTLLSFDPNVNMNQAPKGKVQGADAKTGEKPKGERKEEPGKRFLTYNDQSKLGGLIPNNSGGPQKKVGAGLTAASPETNEKVLKIIATARTERIDMSATAASANMIGTPRLAANEMIRISGVDQQYTGNWYITKTKHSFSTTSVYKTQCTLSRDSGKAKSAEQNKTSGAAAAAGAGGQGKARVAIDTNNTRIIKGGFQ